MKARDLMTSNPECLTPDGTLQEAARLMRDGGFGAIPVVDDQSRLEVVGIITDRDIAIRHVAEGHDHSCRVGDHMTKDVECVSADSDVSDVEDVMSDERIRRLPVVDENDRLIGMIAQADLTRSDDPDDVGDTVRGLSQKGGRHTTH